MVAILLPQYENKALVAGVHAKACWFVEVEEGKGRGSGEGLFGSGKGMI